MPGRQQILIAALLISLAINLWALLQLRRPSVPPEQAPISESLPTANLSADFWAWYLSPAGAAAVPESSKAAEPSLPDTLLIAPGVYSLQQRHFELLREGLYRFSDDLGRGRQHLVYRHDSRLLLSGLAWLTRLGTQDQQQPWKQLDLAMSNRPLEMACSSLLEWVLQVLDSIKLPARMIQTYNLSGQQSHTLLEVRTDKQWQLYDLGLNCRLLDQGRPVDMLGAWQALKAGRQLGCDRLASDLSAPDFAWTPQLDAFQLNSELRNQWYRQILAVPIYREGAGRFSFVPLPANLAGQAQLLPLAALRERFY